MNFNGVEYPTAKLAYAAFLRTDFWMALRGQAVAAANHKCSRCWRTKHLEAHHHHYPMDWFNSTLDDLTVLCAGCHKAQHGKRTLPPNWFIVPKKPVKERKNRKIRLGKSKRKKLKESQAYWRNRYRDEVRRIRFDSQPGNTPYIIFPN